jgi:hypothetical protein
MTKGFAPKSARHFHRFLDMARMRLCRRFDFIGLGRPEIPVPMPVCLQFGTERGGGGRGRARGELKTVRPGAATRERFLEGEGQKAFWCRGGVPAYLIHCGPLIFVGFIVALSASTSSPIRLWARIISLI